MQKIKISLILLAVLLILSLGALAWLINSFTPSRSGLVLLFYVLTTLAGFAASTLIGFYLRKLIGQREFLNSYISSASRQGVWFSLILVVSLVLLSRNLFTWINASFLILTFVFFESYLLTKNNND